MNEQLILVGGPIYCGTNSVATFLHLRDDLFVFRAGYDVIHYGAKILTKDGIGQPFYSHEELSRFSDVVDVKNEQGLLPWQNIAVRENNLIYEFMNAVQDRTLHDDCRDSLMIRCMRKPYELFFSNLWRINSRFIQANEIRRFIADMPNEARKFTAKTKSVLDQCYRVKKSGYNIIFIDVTDGTDSGYWKILDFLGMEPSCLQLDWLTSNPIMNKDLNYRQQYNELRESLRVKGTEILFELYKHPLVVETNICNYI